MPCGPSVRRTSRHAPLRAAPGIGGEYTFVDEVEVFRGPPALLEGPAPGAAVDDPATLILRSAWMGGFAAGWRRTSRRCAPASSPGSRGRRALEAPHGAFRRSRGRSPPPRPGRSTRSARSSRSATSTAGRSRCKRPCGGRPGTGTWSSGRRTAGTPLAGRAAPPGGRRRGRGDGRNEFRAGAFNLSNAGDRSLRLTLSIEGLPGGRNPRGSRSTRSSSPTTRQGVPVAAAMPRPGGRGRGTSSRSPPASPGRSGSRSIPGACRPASTAAPWCSPIPGGRCPSG